MGISNINKKGFGISTTFYSIVIIGVILVAVGYWVTEWSSFYGAGVTYDLGGYNRNDNLTLIVQQYESRLSPDNANPGTDFEATTYTGAFGIISTLFNAFDVAFGNDGLIVSAGNQFGIPSYITQALILMFAVSLVMGIVAIVFRIGRRI